MPTEEEEPHGTAGRTGARHGTAGRTGARHGTAGRTGRRRRVGNGRGMRGERGFKGGWGGSYGEGRGGDPRNWGCVIVRPQNVGVLLASGAGMV